MRKPNRWTSRRQIEVETSLTTIPTDVMSDSPASHARLNRDETEKLTRLRRQGAAAGSAPPPAAPPAASPAPKAGFWSRLFGWK